MDSTLRSQLIPRAEAMTRRLPSAQFVRDGHRIYLDKQNAAYGAMELLREARLAIYDSYVVKMNIRGRPRIEEAPLDTNTSNQILYASIKHQSLDDLKIGAGIELSLKAKLIHLGYVVHYIKKSDAVALKTLRAVQSLEPVKVDELLRLDGFCYDLNKGDCCFIPGLEDQSLTLKNLLKPGYSQALTLDGRDLEFAEVIRERRNMIHLPIGEHQNRDVHFEANLSANDVFGFVERHIEKFAADVAGTISNDNDRRLLLYAVTEELANPSP